MKKLFTVLGMVLALATVTACGETQSDISASNITPDRATSYAESYISLINDVATQGVDIEGNADYFEQYCGITADVMTATVDSYNTALAEMGNYTGEVKDVTYTETEDELTIQFVIVGEQKESTQTLTFDPNTGMLTSASTNVIYTLGEMIETAALNTVLGLGTVFSVLIILWGLIACFKLVPYLENKKKAKAETASSVDKAVTQIVQNEETQDDTELIAVIAAAIAASEGAASTDGYVVRSIRRRY